MAKGKIRVRRAKPGDKGLFLKLWAEYLGDKKLDEAGGVPVTEHNLSIFEQLFDAYVNEEWQGVVLLHAEDAVLLWGDPGGQLFESSLGRQAQAWGVYVRESYRKKGVADALRSKAVNILRQMEFDTISGHVDPNNEAAYQSVVKFGFNPGALMVSYSLKE
jgi:ribosomal protein S18 acetylase RimI-like enzyme